METDVIVVGFGAAGACAAIEAAQAGAGVTLFEVASGSGGTSALSGGEIYLGGGGGTPAQQQAGFVDDTEALFFFWYPSCSYPTVSARCPPAASACSWRGRVPRKWATGSN